MSPGPPVPAAPATCGAAPGVLDSKTSWEFSGGLGREDSHVTMPSLAGIGFEGQSYRYAQMKALANECLGRGRGLRGLANEPTC